MGPSSLSVLRAKLLRFWVFSPEKLWLLSIALNSRGNWRLAFVVKQLNTILYHNSLATGATVSPDIFLGHYAHGITINNDVTIGKRVKIWHNVTLLGGRQARNEKGRATGTRGRIVIEDNARIGNNVVVISPRGRVLRIGRGARIGAGVVVTQDVPDGGTLVPAPPQLLVRKPPAQAPASTPLAAEAAHTTVAEPAPVETEPAGGAGATNGTEPANETSA